RPFSHFHWKQKTYSNRPLGDACVALGRRLGDPGVTLGSPNPNPRPNPNPNRIGRGSQSPTPLWHFVASKSRTALRPNGDRPVDALLSRCFGADWAES